MLKRYCIALLAGCWLLMGSLAYGQSPTAAPQKILVVGDSLSAEYGLPRGTGWVALLQQRLQKVAADGKAPTAWEVVNASISGDTTSGGRSRLAPLLKTHKPTLLVLELGGNDALRGLPIAQTRDNLEAMIKMAKDQGAKVLLLGMQMPPNYGQAYTSAFTTIYGDLAKRHAIGLVPFFLAGVGDVSNSAALFQADRIHPNQKAQALLLDNVWPALAKQLHTRPAP
jgi:acyl-CoA thioesterase-1